MDNGNALTELEQTKLENYALKNNLLQQQLTANLAARTTFIRGIEAARPGYRWDEQQGLVPADDAVSSQAVPK
jgi:hypothetical protein